MKAILLSLVAGILLAGCSSIGHPTAASGFYRAHIDAPDAESLLLWLDKDGGFRLIRIPENHQTVDGGFRVGGGENGRWRVSRGKVRMTTDIRTWAPHLPKETSYAVFDGPVLRWRDMVFTREENEEEPNQ